MYIIWNDRMWASYDGFVEKRYLSSGCRTRRTCSPTLRHRDHLHVSLTRQGAKGTTSWYYAQVPPPASPASRVRTAPGGRLASDRHFPQPAFHPSISSAGRVLGPA